MHFPLDPRPAPEEQEMMRIQAHIARPSPQPAEIQRLQRAITGFPPRPIADFLLSVCIEHGTDSFFYFHQDTMSADIDQFYNDHSSRLRYDCSFVCLALATFALGSQWTTLTKPDQAGSEHALPEDMDPGHIFYSHARTLIPDILERQCIRSMQAAFVLGVYLMPASAISASYIYMGLALRKALSLGLHLEESEDPQLGEHDKEIQRRLWWAIYSLERTTTVKLNRPRSVSQNIITAALPQPTPSIDDVQRYDNIQQQIANAKLVRILDRISDIGIHSRNDGTSTTTYLSSLKEWKRTLPTSLRLENVHPRTPSYRAVFHLHLNYHFAQIAIAKISVVTVVRTHLRPPSASCSPSPTTLPPSVVSLSTTCIKAATKTLRLFRDLEATRNITRFSFTDFQGCSLATIVVLLAGILDHDPTAQHGRAAGGLRCLRRMAGGNVTALIGVHFIEALRSIANEAHAKLARAKLARAAQSSSRGVDTAAEADYHRWAEWLAAAEAARQSPTAETAPLAAPLGAAFGGGVQPTELLATPVWGDTAPLQMQQVEPSADAPSVFPTTPRCAGAGAQPGFDVEGEFSWGAYNDDQIYFMGLMGLDVLDFTGSPE